jgi:predicted transcriptional regulator
MKKAKIMTTFRLHPKIRKKIKQLADKLELSQAQVVELAVEKLEGNQ